MKKKNWRFFDKTNHPLMVTIGETLPCSGASIGLNLNHDGNNVIFHTRFYGTPYLNVTIENIALDDKHYELCQLEDAIMIRWGAEVDPNAPCDSNLRIIYPLDWIFGEKEHYKVMVDYQKRVVCDGRCPVEIMISEITTTRPRLPGWKEVFRVADCNLGEDGCECGEKFSYFMGFPCNTVEEALAKLSRELSSSNA